MATGTPRTASLTTVAREWIRIGLTGFGGPPAHIALLKRLVVDRREWMSTQEFADANAACGLLPGPASTQLAMFCAGRVAGTAGVIVGGLGFVVPAVVLVILLSLLFLGGSPPEWVRAAGAGSGAAVAAVAVQAAAGLLGPSLARVRTKVGAAGVRLGDLARQPVAAWWAAYLLAGALGAVLIAPYLVLVLLGCGIAEAVRRRGPRPPERRLMLPPPLLAAAPAVAAAGGLGALAWTALKVGALSFGGGFVIIPLMRGDAVHVHHWMTNAQFLNAVALGQVTPGPVVATVAAVGYAAHGLGGALLAAVVAFLPSFSMILLGGGRFARLRANLTARAFLDGAGPAAIGAIAGAGVLLATELREAWQFAVLALALAALLGLRRGVVPTLLGAGAAGVVVVLVLGGPVPH